jgi:hypothetical protein
VSRQRYVVRRVGVVVVLAALLFGVVRGIGALIGGGSAAEGSPGEEAAAVVTSSEPVTETAGSVALAGATDTAVASDEMTPRVPTAEDPARVYIAGDSDAGTFGPYLQQLLDLTRVTTTTLDYKVSSGLTRPDFYDWPARLREQIPLVDPDIVVVTFGGNDAQDIRIDGQLFNVNTPEWTQEYRRRVGEVLDFLTQDGRTVIWVGIPNASSESFTARLQIQRDAVVAELAERPEVRYVDTWDRFSGRSGGYADYVIDPRDGMGKMVRASDGFHLNVTGAEILALDIAEVVRAELRARGAAI